MSANLTQYFIGPAGNYMGIDAQACFWCNIGNGSYTTYTPSKIEFSGVLTKFAPGPFDLALTIVDNTNCIVSINGHDLAGTYTEPDSDIVVTVQGDHAGTVTVFADDGGTKIEPDLTGLPAHNIWIGANG